MNASHYVVCDCKYLLPLKEGSRSVAMFGDIELPLSAKRGLTFATAHKCPRDVELTVMTAAEVERMTNPYTCPLCGFSAAGCEPGHCPNTVAPVVEDVAIVRIAAWQLEPARERLAKEHAKVCKAARKVGAPEPALPVIEVLEEVKWLTCPLAAAEPEQPHVGEGWGRCSCGAMMRTMTDLKVRVTGPKPACAGWELMGVLEPLPGADAAQVRRVPGSDESFNLLPYAEAKRCGECDHCGTRRKRSETYVVRNAETGKAQLVGRNCMKGFLGIDPTFLLRALDWPGYVRDEESMGRARQPDPSVSSFLTLVAIIARLDGYISGKAARLNEEQGKGSGVSTAGRAWDVINWRFPFSKEQQKELKRLSPTQDDADLATRAIAWGKALPAGSEFEHNLRVCASALTCGWKQRGTVAFLVEGLRRAEAAERKALLPKEERKVSTHQGVEKARLDVTVLVDKAFVRDGDFGTSTWYVMHDHAGNVYTWSASGSGHMDEGRWYDLRGSVKRHGDYKGIAQTQLTRCVIALVHDERHPPTGPTPVAPVAVKAKRTKKSKEPAQMAANEGAS